MTVVAALLALAATTAIVLVLAIGSDSSSEPAVDTGAISSQSSQRPDEAGVANAVSGPDEGAAASESRPDEAGVASTVSP
jgi:hypothetical protein